VIEGGETLPEGTFVTIEPSEASPAPGGDEPLYNLGELAVSTGIPDLALNVDHYLYGHPKVSDADK
jgi:hypothetical protein